jgi:hypothetical protein
MSANSITAVSAAIVAVLGAVTALIVAFRPMLTEILEILNKNRAELQKNTQAIVSTGDELKHNTEVTESTHVMVNSQRDAAREQQNRTDNALRAAGIPIPYNPAAKEQVSGTEEPK